MNTPLILASASQARADMLRNAGVAIEFQNARVDENSIKASMLAGGASAREIVDCLAEAKARRVAATKPASLILGCDQVLVFEKRVFDKPENLDQAEEQLRALRGNTHKLLSAAVIFESGEPVWRHIGKARLTMRAFSDRFLKMYLDMHPDVVLSSVGCYQIEAAGAQLFSHVAGDYFSILGLPLLETLQFLRTRGVCQQ